MSSRYLMQVIDRETGEAVTFEPGLRDEKNFVDACVNRVVDLGVGIGRTASHVASDVRTALELELLNLKTHVQP